MMSWPMTHSKVYFNSEDVFVVNIIEKDVMDTKYPDRYMYHAIMFLQHTS